MLNPSLHSWCEQYPHRRLPTAAPSFAHFGHRPDHHTAPKTTWVCVSASMSVNHYISQASRQVHVHAFLETLLQPTPGGHQVCLILVLNMLAPARHQTTAVQTTPKFFLLQHACADDQCGHHPFIVSHMLPWWHILPQYKHSNARVKRQFQR